MGERVWPFDVSGVPPENMAEDDKQKEESKDAETGGTGKARSGKASGSAVPGVKRPAHTLDLKADEVKEDAASDASAKTAEKTTGEPERKAEKPQAAKTPPGGSKPAASSKPKEPPQRTSQSQVAGFVTHLAAGLLGGVIGVVGAGYVLPQIPSVGGVSRDFRQGVDERTAAIETRLAAVEERAAQAAPSGEAKRQAAALDERLAAVEKDWAAIKDAPAAMQERIARLEATLKAMEKTAAGGGDVAQTAAIRRQIEDVTAALETRVGALKGDIDAVSGKLASLPRGAPDTGASAEQASRLDTLTRDVEALRDEAKGAEAARGDGAAVAIRLTALTRAAEHGEPFADQLTALRDAAPEGSDLSVLDAYAAKGVAPLSGLRRRFPERAKAALEAAPRPEGGTSLLDQFLDSASSLVRIRRVDGGGDEGAGAILAKMRKQLGEGELEAAVAAADTLPAPSREALAPWLEEARARIALDAALATVSDALARRLAAGAQQR